MALALFDLDNTLLNGDSDHAWGQFLVDEGIVDAELYGTKNTKFYADYVNGTLDIHAFSKFSFQVLEDTPMDKLKRLRETYMETIIRPMITDKGVATIRSHQARGDVVVIITATNAFITRPIADALGVEHLIATQPAMRNGSYIAEIAGTPCFQSGKITKLDKWLLQNKQSMKGSLLYSDSHNDIPLLKKVDNPVAVDPDDELKRVATSNGWRITSFRQSQ